MKLKIIIPIIILIILSFNVFGVNYDYWTRDNNSSSVFIKINLSAGVPKTIYISSGSTIKNFTSIFECGDDFNRADNTAIGNGWTETHDNSWNIESNQLKYAYASSSNTDLTKSCTADNYIYDTRIYPSQINANFYGGIGSSAITNHRVGWAFQTNQKFDYLILTTAWVDLFTYSTSTWYNLIQNLNNTANTYSINVSGNTASGLTPHNSKTANELNFMTGEQTGTVYVDYILAYKFNPNITTSCISNICTITSTSTNTNQQVEIFTTLTTNLTITDETTITYSVFGNVTRSSVSFVNANISLLSSQGIGVVNTTVSNSTGGYSFNSLSNATYYLLLASFYNSTVNYSASSYIYVNGASQTNNLEFITTTTSNCVVNHSNWFFVPDGCVSSS